MSDWKEFLGEKKEVKDWGKTHVMDVSKEDDIFNRDSIYEDSIRLEDLQKFFVSEVARITKEMNVKSIKWAETKSPLDEKWLIEIAFLEGQLKVFKELAGVEERNG